MNSTTAPQGVGSNVISYLATWTEKYEKKVLSQYSINYSTGVDLTRNTIVTILADTISIPLELLESITRLAIGVLTFPLVFMNPDKYLKEFIIVPIAGLTILPIIRPVGVFLGVLSLSVCVYLDPLINNYCQNHNSFVTKHVVDPATNISTHLGDFVSIISVPLELVESIIRLAGAVFALPSVFINPSFYFKEFIHVPIVGIGKTLNGITLKPIYLISCLVIQAITSYKANTVALQQYRDLLQQMAADDAYAPTAIQNIEMVRDNCLAQVQQTTSSKLTALGPQSRRGLTRYVNRADGIIRGMVAGYCAAIRTSTLNCRTVQTSALVSLQRQFQSTITRINAWT